MNKIMRRIVIVFAISFLPVFGFAEVIGNADEIIENIANPILNNILDGIKTSNAEKYSKDFKASRRMFMQKYDQVQAQIGNWKSYKYLGFLNRETETVVLWKGQFNETNNDVLIKMAISKENGKYLVVGLWFQ
ncbi:hypothetical protein KKC91_07055 [bacterium]|nr:hypothetical protein [bacterium]